MSAPTRVAIVLRADDQASRSLVPRLNTIPRSNKPKIPTPSLTPREGERFLECFWSKSNALPFSLSRGVGKGERYMLLSRDETER